MRREAEAKLSLREEDGKERELRPELKISLPQRMGEGVGMACTNNYNTYLSTCLCALSYLPPLVKLCYQEHTVLF